MKSHTYRAAALVLLLALWCAPAVWAEDTTTASSGSAVPSNATLSAGQDGVTSAACGATFARISRAASGVVSRPRKFGS